MKTIIFILISFLTCSFARGQTSDRYQFLHNGKILFDTTIKNPAPIHDTVFVNLPCDSDSTINPPPGSSFIACLYIDKLSSRLGNSFEEEKLISYTLQTGFNAWREYTLSSIIGDPVKEAKLRALHVKARARGITWIEAASSGSPSSVADRIAFNSRCTKPEEKFNLINSEWEPWNQVDKNAAAVKDSTQLVSSRSLTNAAKVMNDEYWGWFKSLPFARPSFVKTLIKSTDLLSHHYYQKSLSISYHESELTQLNSLCKELGIVYNYRPIFSAELAFSQDELRTKTPAQLYAGWKSQFDAKGYSNLKSDGFYMFSMSWLEVPIPYRLPASMSGARRVASLQDKFINGTTEDHLRLATPPDEE